MATMIDKDETRRRVAINVKRIRAMLGMTQGDLSRKAGIKQPRISQIERGDANLTYTESLNIAEALNSSVDALSRVVEAEPVEL